MIPHTAAYSQHFHGEHLLQIASVVSLKQRSANERRSKDTKYNFNKWSLYIFHPLNSELKPKKGKPTASCYSASASEKGHKSLWKLVP